METEGTTTEQGTSVSGYGRLPEYLSLQIETEMYGVIRLMAHMTRRSAGEIVREALANEGLRKVEGYTSAFVAYQRGERAPMRVKPEHQRGRRGGGKRQAGPKARG